MIVNARWAIYTDLISVYAKQPRNTKRFWEKYESILYKIMRSYEFIFNQAFNQASSATPPPATVLYLSPNNATKTRNVDINFTNPYDWIESVERRFCQTVSMRAFNASPIRYRDAAISLFSDREISAVSVRSDKTRFVREPRLIPRGS